jgi:hypothetical protein
MLPQIRQIHKLVVEEQAAQVDSDGVEGLANGIGTEEREEEDGG